MNMQAKGMAAIPSQSSHFWTLALFCTSHRANPPQEAAEIRN
jgi:hypothetical protein